MLPGPKRAVSVLASGLLVLFAYSPLLQAGLLATDQAAALGAPVGSESLGPLARGSLELSRRMVGPPAVGDAPALVLRLENLLLLLVAATGLGAFVRRLALPWSGSEQAGSAAGSTSLFLAVHPLGVAAVASVGSRGDLLALAFSTWAATAFLRGRQDRRPASTATAFLLCVLAGLSSDLALVLPFVLAAAELASAHRYRPARTRVRTALTTLAVFGAGASIDLVLGLARGGTSELPPGLAAARHLTSVEAVAEEIVRAVEKLGLLVLPANREVSGIAGTVLAGAVFLVAVQPALVAARSAPRLWGRVFFGWGLALLFAELLHAHLVPSAREFSLAAWLLPSVVVMAVGLGLTTTALSGPRHPYVAWIVAVGFACLAHGNARPWRDAGEVAARLRAQLLDARELFGQGAERILVVDPPGAVRGVAPVGDAVAWLVHPGALDPERVGERPPDVRGLEREALLALIPEPELEELLPLVVLLAPEGRETGEDVGDRRAVALTGLRSSEAPRTWRSALKSPALDLEPLREAAVVVRAPAGADVDGLKRLSWGHVSGGRRGSHPGIWLETAHEALGVFDLGASLAWRLGGPVRSLVFEEGAQPIVEAQILSELPRLAAEPPRSDGDDWVLPAPESAVVEAAGAAGGFAFSLLDLAELSYEELDVRVDPSGELRILDAGRRVDELLDRSAGPVVWRLDYRIAGRAIARLRGRVEGRG